MSKHGSSQKLDEKINDLDLKNIQRLTKKLTKKLVT